MWILPVRGRHPSVCLLICVLVLVFSSGTDAAVPQTPKRPVSDVYHGTTVVDEYRWLEDAANPEVKEWTREQRGYGRGLLDAVPERPALVERLRKLYLGASTSYHSLQANGGLLFALKRQPPAQQLILVTLKSADDPGSEQTILDPNKLDPKGLTSINLYWPSPDGKLVAVSLTEGGSEEGTLFIYDVARGARKSDQIPRVAFATAGGSLAWKADSSGFYYTRYPRTGERPEADLNFYQQVYYHRLGSDENSDTYVIGKEFPRIAEIALQMLPADRGLIVSYQLGDGGNFAHFLVAPDGSSKQLAGLEDGVKFIAIAPNGDLYLFSRQNAPRGKILRLKSGESDLAKASLVVPESQAVVSGYDTHTLEIQATFYATRDNLYITDIIGGPSQLRDFDLDGHFKRFVPAEAVSTISQVVPFFDDEILFHAVSYLQPGAWFLYNAASGKATRTALAEKSPMNFDDCELVRESASSRDGTKVPLSIIRRKGTKLDGKNPTLLSGYGGYGIVISPAYLTPKFRLWLDHGGVFCMANLRGGGEFGEEWHQAGNLTRKQNVFDDFSACAEFLIKSGYTDPKKLAIEGGSNGGLL
ncbi:MAG TPA: prolyl oligopeptidase family serine peptidase, partial [Verrucomicrobiae bacterium]|nr:prolyl oligopeptidase family serine peptidase [Verrucomicrobiae bacterium]